jgi:cell division protein FtsB
MKSKIEKRRKRRKVSKKILPKIMLSIVVVGMLAAAIAIFFTQEAQIERLKAHQKDLSIQAEAALEKKQENEDLLEKSDSLEYIEKIAREQLGMVKPGETVFPD